MNTTKAKTTYAICGRYGPKVNKCCKDPWSPLDLEDYSTHDRLNLNKLSPKQKKRKIQRLAFVRAFREWEDHFSSDSDEETNDFCTEEVYPAVVDKVATAPRKVINLTPASQAAPVEDDYVIDESSSDEEVDIFSGDDPHLGNQTIFDGKDITKKFWSFSESDFSFLVQASEILRNGCSQMESKSSIFTKISRKFGYGNPNVDKVKLVEDLFCVFYFVYKMHLQNLS